MATAQRGRPKKQPQPPKRSVDESPSPTSEQVQDSPAYPDVGGGTNVNWSVVDREGGSDSVAAVDSSGANNGGSDRAISKSEIDVRLREQQWEMLSKTDKDRLNMTRDEFLAREDVTGFGFNSRFTPLEERRGR
jgi:hypothetical protein